MKQTRLSSNDLTDREKEILKLIAEDYSSKEIADALHLSVRTVEANRGRISLKFGGDVGIAGMTKAAIRMGLTNF